MLQQEAVEKGTLDLIKRFMEDQQFKPFYLVGGTALALKIGHRRSIDIDLFTEKSFNAKEIATHIEASYPVQNLRSINNGVFCFVSGVKVDIIAHQYPLLNSIEEVEGIRMLSLLDIGAMKLNAIYGNGTRLKDYIDIYSLLAYIPLQEILQACERKYPDIDATMAKTALLYHNDIDPTEKVDFIGIDIKWPEVADRLKQAAANPRLTFGPSQQTLKLLQIKQQRNIRPDKNKGRGL
ncbi:nucleotidyl transferase AbiEii/AbiGii toxin family protein [Chitinophaga japonensis]|uniref:Nucleotidyltransferase AbiEii toxin of type IV toxin-antitoxin system n=1 Tax=Chitinophaga japonensis TaxID=104662 RepID=A0A562SMN6_CHIJA|nr:nucleotidyl transferase AbiEii/AbiGii toxin family protein [Chitinophaga japonensis]TWI82567.1 nucleotidyltransferase AbiEii toxin of type IV toxin-antitoxin system [Chitinophaga japonensis]